MKKIFVIIAALFFAASFGNEAKANQEMGGYGYFYTALSPEGTWIELDNGVTVWQPAGIRSDWAPYTQGEWVWTADGWYWNSYEPFGYITYHYGRWYNDDYYGWIWVPDDQWGPSWVEWRYNDDYIGWAPLPPYATFSVNFGLQFSMDYHTPYNHWHFVKYGYFCDPYVSNYYVGPQYRERVFAHTRYRNDYAYDRGRVINRGVDIDVIRKRTGQDIRERQIVRTSDPREVTRNSGGRNDQVRAFVASREELQRTPEKVNIKRADRKTTLQTNKVEIGRVAPEARGDRRNVIDNTRTNANERNVEKANPDNGRNGKRNPEVNNRGNNTESPAVRNENRPNGKRQAAAPEVRNPQVNRREAPQQTKTEPRFQPNQRKEAPAPSVRQPERKVQSQPREQPRVQAQPRERRQVQQQPREQPRVQQQPREQRRSEPARTERGGGNNRGNGSDNKDKRQR